MHKFPIQTDKLRLLRDRDANVSLRKDRNYVPWLQRQVLRCIVLQHQPSQVKGQQNRLQSLRIQPFDNRIIPVASAALPAR